jgi:hypothetical protein
MQFSGSSLPGSTPATGNTSQVSFTGSPLTWRRDRVASRLPSSLTSDELKLKLLAVDSRYSADPVFPNTERIAKITCVCTGIDLPRLIRM